MRWMRTRRDANWKSPHLRTALTYRKSCFRQMTEFHAHSLNLHRRPFLRMARWDALPAKVPDWSRLASSNEMLCRIWYRPVCGGKSLQRGPSVRARYCNCKVPSCLLVLATQILLQASADGVGLMSKRAAMRIQPSWSHATSDPAIESDSLGKTCHAQTGWAQFGRVERSR
jgi:hypothetical protein